VFYRHSLSPPPLSLSTKQIVFCRHFLYKTRCVPQVLSLQNTLCSAGTLSTKHVVFCRNSLYQTSCVLQVLSLQNTLCSAGTLSTKQVVFCRHFLYKTRCVLQALSLQNMLCSADTLCTKHVSCKHYATPPTNLREFLHLQRKCICHSANTNFPLHKYLIV
jgi:hypothetical protein